MNTRKGDTPLVTPCRLAALAATALLLAGCQTTFDLVGVAVPLSASQSRVYDGSYQGTITPVFSTPVSSTGMACPREHGERVLFLGDGVLWYAYDPTTLFAAPVNSDGRIQSTEGNATLAGKITGNHLQAMVTSPACSSRISMDFIYDHS